MNLYNINDSPYPSWVYDYIYKRWNPPYNHPDDEKVYLWIEATQQWIEVLFGEA